MHIPVVQNVILPVQSPVMMNPIVPNNQPVTENSRKITLYIGHLSEDFKDDFFEQILNHCGGVKNWKRAKYSFGFVEFADAEGALRAKKILDGLRIKDKKIIVNCDAEIQKVLDDFEKGLKIGQFPLRIVNDKEDAKASIEQRLKARDAAALSRIQALIKENRLEPTIASSSNSRSRSSSTRKDGHNRSRERKKRRSGSRSRKRRRRSRSRDRNRKRRKAEDQAPKTQKELIALIPKEPKQTLNYQIDWDLVKKSGLVEKKMRRWIDDRLTEYMGGQEDVELTNFVVGLLAKQTLPEKIKTELAVVLVEDAENFVVKMWRRLIFETMKIKYGLA